MKIYSHPFSHDTHSRGQREVGMNVWEVASQRLKVDAPKTFATAWAQAQEGKAGALALKVTGVAVGAALMGDGLYNMAQGYGEEVEDLMLGSKVGSNHVRMFTGATELGLGIAALYMGLTKGMIR